MSIVSLRSSDPISYPTSSGGVLSRPPAMHEAGVVYPVDSFDLPTVGWVSLERGPWRRDRVPTRGEHLIRAGGREAMRRCRAVLILQGSYLAVTRRKRSDFGLQRTAGSRGVFATLPAGKQAEFFDNDFLALAAAQGDWPPMDNLRPTVTMPCFLHSGEADCVLPDMQKYVQQIPNATFVSVPGLNHPEAFYRSDVVLSPVMEFLRSVA